MMWITSENSWKNGNSFWDLKITFNSVSKLVVFFSSVLKINLQWTLDDDKMFI